MYKLIARLYISLSKERVKGNWVRSNLKNKTNKKNILVSHPESFRSDVEYFSDNAGDFRVFMIGAQWQVLLAKMVYGNKIPGSAIKIEQLPKCKKIEKKRLKYEKILKHFYSYLEINLLLVSNNRYALDYDWNVLTVKLGIPCVMLFREGLVIDGYCYDILRGRNSQVKNKYFSNIIVHNKHVKRAFIDSGIIKPSKVHVAGVLRCDTIKQFNISKLKVKNDYKILVFMPFGRQPAGGNEILYEQYYDSVVKVLVNVALNNTNIEVVFKFKPERFKKSDHLKLISLVEKMGHDIININNINLSFEKNIYSLIYNSRIITGLSSTALLESFLFDKTVVLPWFSLYFDKLNKHELRSFPYRNYLHLFSIARSEDEYAKQLLGLDNLSLDAEMANKRRELCEEFIIPTNFKSLEITTKIMNNVASVGT